MDLDLKEFRRLAGIEESRTGPLRLKRREEPVVKVRRNPLQLIEHAVGVREEAPTLVRTREKVQPKKPPSYRELYRENRSLVRENTRLHESNEVLASQVQDLVMRSGGPQRGYEGGSLTPWDLQSDSAPHARVRIGDGLREFMDYTGEELLPSGRAPRPPRKAHKRPSRPPKGTSYTSAAVRPETLGGRPSLFPSFEEESVEREVNPVSRWESLDYQDSEATNNSEVVASPRFESCVDEFGPGQDQARAEPTSIPRFEGLLTESKGRSKV